MLTLTKRACCEILCFSPSNWLKPYKGALMWADHWCSTRGSHFHASPRFFPVGLYGLGRQEHSGSLLCLYWVGGVGGALLGEQPTIAKGRYYEERKNHPLGYKVVTPALWLEDLFAWLRDQQPNQSTEWICGALSVCPTVTFKYSVRGEARGWTWARLWGMETVRDWH